MQLSLICLQLQEDAIQTRADSLLFSYIYSEFSSVISHCLDDMRDIWPIIIIIIIITRTRSEKNRLLMATS